MTPTLRTGSSTANACQVFSYQPLLFSSLMKMSSACLQNGQLFRGDVAQDAHGQARSREGVAVENVGGDVQQAGHFPHLVLEQELEGLDDPALLFQLLHFRAPGCGGS